MYNMYWGVNNKKRKLESNDNYESRTNKKIKLFKEENKLIYSIGTEIHFTDDITTESIEVLIKKITKIINKNHEKYDGGDEKLNVTIVCDSGGGSVIAILKFVDFVSMCKTKYPYVEFTSVLTGMCASAATILCVVCDHRHATKLSSIMLHELSSGRNGTYTHLQSHGKYLTDLHNKLVNIYMENCDIERNKLEDFLMKETWYTAEEYLNAGFIDKII